MVAATLVFPLIEGGVIGAWLLRRAWTGGAGRRKGLLVAGGWAVLMGTLALAMWRIGPVKGIAAAAVLAPIGILLVVAGGRTRRAAREGSRQSLAPEPLQGPSKAWRGAIRFLLAGPLGMLAAMGIAFCYASWAPGAVTTRLLIAALLVPALWGLAMTWTLADQRILRAAAVLVGTTIVGFGFAFLGGIA